MTMTEPLERLPEIDDIHTPVHADRLSRGNPELARLLRDMTEHEVGQYCSGVLLNIWDGKDRLTEIRERQLLRATEDDYGRNLLAINKMAWVCAARSILDQCVDGDIADVCIERERCPHAR